MDFGPYPSTLGLEWVVDAYECAPERLRAQDAIVGLVDRLVDELALHPLGAPLVHVFPGEGGITAMLLLSESHLAVHTFPEFQIATISLYCCRKRAPIDWERTLAECLSSRSASVRTLERGGERPCSR
jgi:S-adenosylmethionine decarboxylase